MAKHKIYVNIYNLGITNFDGSKSKDYDGKMAFKTPEAARETAKYTGRWQRTEERLVNDGELANYILSDEWDQADD